MKQLLLFLITCLSYSQHIQAQEYILDESYRDRDFLAFKLKFVQALLDEDVEAIKSMVGEHITAQKDPEFLGKKGFVAHFLKDKKSTKEFCKHALKLISFGFRETTPDEFDKKNGYTKKFYAPSFHSHFQYYYTSTKHKHKTKAQALILGENVNVREKPTIKAKVIDRISYEIVEYQFPIDDPWQPEVRKTTQSLPEGKYWYAIKLKNGKIGYVIEDYVSDNYYIDLCVAKTPNGWKLVSYFIPYRC